MKRTFLYMALCLLTVCSCRPSSNQFSATVTVPEVPVLAFKATNMIARVDLVNHIAMPYTVKSVRVLIKCTENLSDITKVTIFQQIKRLAQQL
jgi:hypothetical protein